MLSEHLASYFFRRVGEQAPDPVLAELLAFIAADEVRHAQAASDLLAARIARDPIDRARPCSTRPSTSITSASRPSTTFPSRCPGTRSPFARSPDASSACAACDWSIT